MSFPPSILTSLFTDTNEFEEMTSQEECISTIHYKWAWLKVICLPVTRARDFHVDIELHLYICHMHYISKHNL